MTVTNIVIYSIVIVVLIIAWHTVVGVDPEEYHED